MKLFLIAALLLITGFAVAAPHTDRPHVQVVVVDESLNQFAVMWQKEVERKLPNAVVVLCHGGSFIEGEWAVKAPFGEHQVMKVGDLVKHYQALYPKRTLVLLACNPGHLKLGIPGVYYSSGSVWCVPDRDIISHQQMQYMKLSGKISGPAIDDEEPNEQKEDRSSIDPDTIGNIFEFECE